MGGEKPFITRRTALKAAIGTSSFLALGKPVSAEDPIEIPVAISGDEVIETRKVDREWWYHVEQSRGIREDFEAEVGRSPEVRTVSTTGGEELINGHSKRKLRIKVNRNELSDNGGEMHEQMDVSLPDKYQGLDVEVVPVDYSERHCYNSDTYDDVPGAVIYHPDGNESLWATFCCSVTHSNYENPLMLATDHAQSSDNDIYQGDNSFGSPTSERDSTLDYQLIENESSEIGVTESILDIDHEVRYPINGYATNLEALEDEETTMRKSAVTSGFVYAEIDDINGHEVTFDGEGAQGDSGSPWYYLTGTDKGIMAVLVAMETHGPNFESYTCDGYTVYGGPESVGTSAEAIADHDDDISFPYQHAGPLS